MPVAVGVATTAGISIAAVGTATETASVTEAAALIGTKAVSFTLGTTGVAKVSPEEVAGTAEVTGAMITSETAGTTGTAVGAVTGAAVSSTLSG